MIEALVERKVAEKLASLSPAKGLVDLAKIGVPKRTVYRDARAGKIDGAVKIERRWYATQAAVDEWIASHATEKAERPAGEADVSYLDGARERLGLRRVS
jgi:hypothetical protein